MQPSQDGVLVQRFLQGDESALTTLYEQHIPAVYAFLSRLAPKQIDLEDLTQIAFVKAWQHLKTFDQTKSFKTWIFTIAKNTLLDTLKKRQELHFTQLDPEEGLSFEEQIPDTQPLILEELQRVDLEKDIDQLLGRLAWPQRLIITLHLFEDLTFQQIADMQQEPMDTVKTRYRRALLKLRQHMIDGTDRPS